MILAAQAQAIERNGSGAVTATTNVRHLTVFSAASIWREIG